MKANSAHKLNWKLAIAGGVVLGAGFGTLSVAGADTTTPAGEETQLNVSAGTSVLSLRSAPHHTDLGPSTSAATDASIDSVASIGSVASIESSADSVSPPEPSTDSAPSLSSPASVDSPSSVD